VDTAVLCDALEERFCGDSAAPLDGIRQIPAAAQETMGLCNDPDGSVVKLADVVNRDPTLTQALLRYANSAFYARSGQSAAVSIPDAVARVGVAGVRNVVLSVTVEGLVSRPGGELDKVAEAVWAHMVRVAPFARLIARAYPAAPETAFALGLLHDVGKMIVVDLASALRSKLRRPVSMPAPHTREILLALHEPLGGLCALRWNLGPEAARAIATHHRTTPPAARDAMSEVLYLAERVDHASERREEVNLATLWEQGALGGRVERVAQALAGELDATVTF
jgi:HD-like signal output (HDOD) protein